MYDNSVCLRLHIFPLVQYIYMFSRVQQRLHILPLVQYKLHVSSRLANLHVFPRLSQITAVLVFPLCENVTSLPALDTDYMFLTSTVTTTFGNSYRHVFQRLALGTCFPAFGTGYILSHVFQRLASVSCFPAFGPGCVFRRLALGTCFPALERDFFPRLATKAV